MDFLNFLCRAIVPGRAFTRYLYAHTAGAKLKPHHHVKVTGEMKADLQVWLQFLQCPEVFSQPFIDYLPVTVQDLDWTSDASRNFNLGFGGICGNSWFIGRWDDYVAEVEPSIEYLELFAITVAILI